MPTSEEHPIIVDIKHQIERLGLADQDECEDAAEIILCQVETLIARLSPAAGEAVAWQYRYKNTARAGAAWTEWGEHNLTLPSYPEYVEEKRPLYPAPPAVGAETGGLVERLRGHYEHGIGSDDIDEAAAALESAEARIRAAELQLGGDADLAVKRFDKAAIRWGLERNTSTPAHTSHKAALKEYAASKEALAAALAAQQAERDRASQRVAELERERDALADRGTLQALRDANDRAEAAEQRVADLTAERDTARMEVYGALERVDELKRELATAFDDAQSAEADRFVAEQRVAELTASLHIATEDKLRLLDELASAEASNRSMREALAEIAEFPDVGDYPTERMRSQSECRLNVQARSIARAALADQPGAQTKEHASD